MRLTLSIIAVSLIVLAALFKAWKKPGQAQRLQPGKMVTTLLVIVLLACGTGVRTYLFGQIPAGISVDEAVMGYDAYSLLYYGIDHNGFHNPVHLVSFGSGQHALPAYLSMPFIALLGLNPLSVRLVNLIFGILSLVIFFLLVRKTDDLKTALLALFFLATNPWHIMISRWGLESNLLPAMFLLATWLLAKSFNNRLYFLGSMFFYGLALYAYGTLYMMLPVFLSFTIGTLLIHQKIQLKTVLAGLAILAVIGLPILLYVIINTFHLESIQSSWISIPRLPGEARFSQVSAFFSDSNFLRTVFNNASSLFRLLVYQDDRLIWNAIPGFGTLYLFSLPLALLGLWALIKEQAKTRQFQANFLFLAWLGAAFLLGIVMIENINRINIIYLPLIYLIAKGVAYISQQFKLLAAAVLLIFIVWFALFSQTYFHGYSEQIGAAFNESLDQAINYAADHTDGTIYMTRQVNLPFIYVLFYRHIDPNIFLRTVQYDDPQAAFRNATSFGNYRFIGTSDMPPGGGAYIIENREQEQFKLELFTVQKFKHYSVLISR